MPPLPSAASNRYAPNVFPTRSAMLKSLGGFFVTMRRRIQRPLYKKSPGLSNARKIANSTAQLRSHGIRVDNRWQVKLSCYTLNAFYDGLFRNTSWLI